MTNFPPANPQSPYGIQPEQQGGKSGSDNTLLFIILGVVGVCILMCGGVLVALLVPAMGAAKQASVRMQRSNNLKQIGIGIHNYHAAYKQLPMTVAVNSKGEELAGWRLGLSPFVEGQVQWQIVTQDYGPESRQLVADRPPPCMQASDGLPGETHVFAIVSDGSAFPPTPNTKIGFRDVVDGPSNTAFLIELPNRTTNWTSNENLSPAEAFQAIRELPPGQVAHLVMGDGSVVAVDGKIEQSLFDKITTRAGGEIIEEQF